LEESIEIGEENGLLNPFENIRKKRESKYGNLEKLKP
jgi:hypothetical protein